MSKARMRIIQGCVIDYTCQPEGNEITHASSVNESRSVLFKMGLLQGPQIKNTSGGDNKVD